MGSIMSAIEDDFADYKEVCKVMDIEALSIFDGSCFYDHAKKIKKTKKYQKLLKEKKVPYL